MFRTFPVLVDSKHLCLSMSIHHAGSLSLLQCTAQCGFNIVGPAASCLRAVWIASRLAATECCSRHPVQAASGMRANVSPRETRTCGIVILWSRHFFSLWSRPNALQSGNAIVGTFFTDSLYFLSKCMNLLPHPANSC